MSKLNWRMILYLSMFGPFMGVLIVMGAIPRGLEGLPWLVIGLFCAFWIALRQPYKQFPHGALVGFISGVASTLIQGVFSNTYVENNPWVVEEFADMPAGFDIQFFTLLLVPFIGVASALVMGLMTYLAVKVTRRKLNE